MYPSAYLNDLNAQHHHQHHHHHQPHHQHQQQQQQNHDQHHKFLQEQQQHLVSAGAQMIKQDISMDESSGPIYPRPMYHYDPLTGVLPPGFSAINLSVKIGPGTHPALLAQHQHQLQPSNSPNTNNLRSPARNGPFTDHLSTASVSSSSPHGFNSPQYANGQRVQSGSPQPGSSPHHMTSPQVPSPQGQTLDLSVTRLPNR